MLSALFSYVKANDVIGPPLTAVPTRDWTAGQYEEIQLLAMSALCTLAPLMISDYIECHGGTRLLLMLDWCVSKGLYLPISQSVYHSSKAASRLNRLAVQRMKQLNGLTNNGSNDKVYIIYSSI